MLTKEEFVNEVREGLFEHIKGDFAGDAHIEIVEVTKNNDQVLTGAVVKSEAMPIVPTIYFDREYEKYKSGKPMEMILSEMGEAYSEALANAPKFNIDMMDKNGIMNRIVCSVLNMSENRNRLKELMYTPLGNDLALMYAVRVDDEARAPISKEYAQKLGLSLADLNTLAMENTPRYYPPVMRSLTDVAIGMGYSKNVFEERHEQGLNKDFYVLSNDEAVFGASTLFYPEVKELLGEMLGVNFYVLPSSLHEVILVPEDFGVGLEELMYMVRNANETVVDAVDKLSDEVFHFDVERGELSIASKPERDLSQDAR